MNGPQLNRLIDHTLLRPEATPDDVRRLCDEAHRFDFFSVCVNTHFVPLAAERVAGSGIAVCSIAGFPLGAVDTAVKAFEAGRAVERGAGEIDMVMNVGALKAGERGAVRDDISAVVEACGGRAVVKVIIEAALLDDPEIADACRLSVEAGAAFVKSSTGFGPPGADPRTIRLMRETVGPDIGVKASAGIRTAAFALELVAAGASRIGTSAGVQIMSEWMHGGR
ncbi:MAG: deoxyribose-phosphate aldolase [Candidatus Krumholzibacteria bacterium]|nr:deoxyribose-phosphate aldolase [Candidatus Krumholzibacteria bacterium]